jgi:ketosteroid isomerase-like protein
MRGPPRLRDTGRAMSQENVEVVRKALEAWQRDDLDAFLARGDPAVEWHAVFERLLGGTEHCYRGIEGLREFWSVYRTEFENFEIEGQEIRVLDEVRVLLLGQLRWRGPTSGIESESPVGLVLSLRNGKIFGSMDYLSHEEALEAVGLSD